MTLPCIVCKKVLEPIHVREEGSFDPTENFPNDAVSFTAPGQYGSTVFDPMDGSTLEINVCDQCLLEASKAREVLLNEPIVPTVSGVSFWKEGWNKE